MSSPGTAGGMSLGAKVGIAVASVVVVVGAGGIAFAATDGFGMLGESSDSAPAASGTPSADDVVVGERQEDAVVGDAPATSMDEIFDKGKSVECTYTFEGYDATTTLKSKETYRIDQQTQGGLAHVIRTEASTLLWVDGMTAAEKYETGAYEAMERPATHPTFNTADFEAVMVDDPETCVEIPVADDALFTLPDGMTTVPGTRQ